MGSDFRLEEGHPYPSPHHLIKSGSTVASDWARGLAFFQKVSGTALAHAETLHGGIARADPWTRLAEKKFFANL